MNIDVIFEHDDVLMACIEGNRLLAIKLLVDKTGLSIQQCSLGVDAFVKENPELFPHISIDMLDTNIDKLESTNLIRHVKIESRRSDIQKEIDSLYRNIELLNQEKVSKNEELIKQKAVLAEKKTGFISLINSKYSKENINKSIDEFYASLNTNYSSRYNSNLSVDELKFKSEIYKYIKYKSVESIIEKMKFQHNNGKLKVKGCFIALLLLGSASILFMLAFENCRPYVSLLSNDRGYNFIGYLLNIIGGLLALVGLGQLFALSLVPSVEVVEIIKSEGDPNARRNLNFLNSIHSLPDDIKMIIKYQ
jgi:hypothetical protein